MMTPAPVPAPLASEPAATRVSWLDAATLVLLTTGWVYLAGWAYAWRFFSHVQLGLLALDIPQEYFFVYGLWVCQRWALLLPAAAGSEQDLGLHDLGPVAESAQLWKAR